MWMEEFLIIFHNTSKKEKLSQCPHLVENMTFVLKMFHQMNFTLNYEILACNLLGVTFGDCPVHCGHQVKRS